MKAAGIQCREVWRYEVIDPAQVPREYSDDRSHETRRRRARAQRRGVDSRRARLGRAHDRGHGAVSMADVEPSGAAETQAARRRRSANAAPRWRRRSRRCAPPCGGATVVAVAPVARRAHHLHHVRYRSQGGRWTTTNCVLLCRACHQDVHARILAITGSNADDPGGLTFERRVWWSRRM